MHKKLKILLLLTVLIAIPVSYNGCMAKTQFNNNSDQDTFSHSIGFPSAHGNGVPVDGKLVHYTYTDRQACNMVGIDLSTYQRIRKTKQNAYFLVVDRCRPIKPIPISGTALKFLEKSQSLVYSGKEFALDTSTKELYSCPTSQGDIDASFEVLTNDTYSVVFFGEVLNDEGLPSPLGPIPLDGQSSGSYNLSVPHDFELSFIGAPGDITGGFQVVPRSNGTLRNRFNIIANDYHFDRWGDCFLE